MIRFDVLRERNILVVTPDGPLEIRDFENFEKEIDPLIASNGRLVGLLIHAKAFPGWRSFGAFASHIRFVVDHHRQIERIAVVTNSKFLRVLPPIAGYLVHPKIKNFSFEEKDQALAWLETA